MAERREFLTGRRRGELLFLLLYLPALAWMVAASTPEVTRDFGRVAKDFRVVAMRDGKPEATTLARIGQPDPQRTFLLGVEVVELPLGDLHKATVLQKHAGWQLIEYEFANGSSTVSRYRAFRDRVEPVSHRLTFSPGLIVTGALLAVPAAIIAALGSWLWGRATGEKASPAAPTTPAKQALSRLGLGLRAYTIGSIVLGLLATMAYGEPALWTLYALFAVLAILGGTMRWAVVRLGKNIAAQGVAAFCLGAAIIAWLVAPKLGPIAVPAALAPVAVAAIGIPRDWPLKWLAAALGLCAAAGALLFFLVPR